MTALDRLAATIAARKGADPETSWTAKLLAKGPEKCAEKFGEEAVEAIIEAVKGDRAGLTAEAADVLYHLLVMLAARDVTLADVLAELERREGTFGPCRKGRARSLRRARSPPEAKCALPTSPQPGNLDRRAAVLHHLHARAPRPAPPPRHSRTPSCIQTVRRPGRCASASSTTGSTTSERRKISTMSTGSAISARLARTVSPSACCPGLPRIDRDHPIAARCQEARDPVAGAVGFGRPADQGDDLRRWSGCRAIWRHRSGITAISKKKAPGAKGRAPSRGTRDSEVKWRGSGPRLSLMI